MHTRHAHGCNRVVPPAKFACRPHWLALRPALQRAIWNEYRYGQEVRKDPSLRYVCVQRRAVAELALKPLDEEAARISAEYLYESEKWRKVCIERGLGDPLEGIDDRRLFDGIETARLVS